MTQQNCKIGESYLVKKVIFYPPTLDKIKGLKKLVLICSAFTSEGEKSIEFMKEHGYQVERENFTDAYSHEITFKKK